jgi:hypothetical protein
MIIIFAVVVFSRFLLTFLPISFNGGKVKVKMKFAVQQVIEGEGGLEI